MDANMVVVGTISSSSFNPRARDGREAQMLLDTVYTPVSIHAPVMDAKLPCSVFGNPAMFQSTRP